MKVGDKVVHVQYPARVGRVVAKSKKWPSELQTFLVRWEDAKGLSRHIESALKRAR